MADIICGVDIGAKALDARIDRNGAWQQFERTEAGIAELASFCKHHQVGLVVMEATGGYERLPFAQLWAADMPVAAVNPRSVRRFAESMGALEKTDKIDTGMIAWYAETKRIVPTPPASDKQQRFTALAPMLPGHSACVAESGVATPSDAEAMRRLGYRLALIGTALMSCEDPAALLAEILNAARTLRA